MLALTLIVGCGNTDKKKDSNPSHKGHEYVDLGLSVKWATCNIGAENPEVYGECYAWGEVITKSRYTRDYCESWKQKIDDIKGTNQDVAHFKWGGSWRMPTKEEFEELCEKCNWVLTGSGYKVTGPNGNSIYLPAAGFRDGGTLNGDGSRGDYWSSTSVSESTRSAYYLFFNSDDQHVSWSYRGYGYPVRPVLE
jgi:uncharacterized protein (TIGR02145 family)